jgi:hypothetical protein
MSVTPGFFDAAPLARALIECSGSIIWGSDYPHLPFADKVGSIEHLTCWAGGRLTTRCDARFWSTTLSACLVSKNPGAALTGTFFLVNTAGACAPGCRSPAVSYLLAGYSSRLGRS